MMADDHNAMNDSLELWRHPAPENTKMYAFMKHVNGKHNISCDTYQDLWQWSVEHPAAFWEEIWHYTSIKFDKNFKKV